VKTVNQLSNTSEPKDVVDSIAYVLDFLSGDLNKLLSEDDLAQRIGTHYTHLLLSKEYLAIEGDRFKITEKFLQHCG
jgi:hypothetical protein